MVPNRLLSYLWFAFLVLCIWWSSCTLYHVLCFRWHNKKKDIWRLFVICLSCFVTFLLALLLEVAQFYDYQIIIIQLLELYVKIYTANTVLCIFRFYPKKRKYFGFAIFGKKIIFDDPRKMGCKNFHCEICCNLFHHLQKESFEYLCWF